MNIKIIVCCHKQDLMAGKEPYLPIHVGKALHPDLDLGIQTDDSGDNISSKNGSYCELTGMYWAWKNLKGVDAIGLCHYRRYFDFHKQISTVLPMSNISADRFGDIDLTIPDEIIGKIAEGKVVVPKYTEYPRSGYNDYCVAHISDDLRILEKIIKTEQDTKYAKAFYEAIVSSNKVLHYNMFIMKWEDFDAYCSWLFPLLGRVEEEIDISAYNPTQKRIFGYMSERLLLLWLKANDKSLVEIPVMRFLNKKNPGNYSDLTYTLLRTLYKMSMLPIKICNWVEAKRHPEVIYGR